jgi:hypothetical protein
VGQQTKEKKSLKSLKFQALDGQAPRAEALRLSIKAFLQKVHP